MNKLILLSVILNFCQLASARTLTEMITGSVGQQEDQLAICYIFKNNQVAKKSPCVYESHYGSDGWNATSYSFDSYTFGVESSASTPLTLNSVEAQFYQRYVRSFNILDPRKSYDNFLGCYRVVKKNLDFCVKRMD
jgi:hypothetical protein